MTHRTAVLPVSEDLSVPCVRCRTLLAPDMRYCPHCGTMEALPEGWEEPDADRGSSAAERLPLTPSQLAVHTALQRSPVFGVLPPSGIDILAKTCFRRRYVSGEWAAREGGSGERASVIASGFAQISVNAGRDRRVVVRTLGPGDMFGEPAVFTGGRRAVSVQAVSTLEVYVFPQDTLLELSLASPPFSATLTQHLRVAIFESLLRRASPFSSLPPQALQDLAADVAVNEHAHDTVIFHEGDIGDAVYVIRRGSVKIIAGGRQVASLHAGDCFGEAALLTDLPRNATVQADDDVQVLRVDRDRFQAVLAAHPEVHSFFIELERLRNIPTGEAARTLDGSTSRRGDASGIDVGMGRKATSMLSLTLAFSALVSILATTRHGGYLIAPAMVLPLAATPVTAYALVAKWDLWDAVSFRHAGFAGLLMGLLGWGVPLMIAAGDRTALLATEAAWLLLAGIVAVTGWLRRSPLEPDYMATGAAGGLAFGAVLGFVSLPGIGLTDRSALTPDGWCYLVGLPALTTIAGTLLGSGMWAARRGAAGSFVGYAGLGALGLAAPITARVFDLTAAWSIAMVTVGIVGTALAARHRLRIALAERARVLAALGLKGVASGAAGALPYIVCRTCGTTAKGTMLYCARCGQSLLDEQSDKLPEPAYS